MHGPEGREDLPRPPLSQNRDNGGPTACRFSHVSGIANADHERLQIAVLSMIAIEAAIVTTAMPQLVRALGDFQLYGWVFTTYLLGQTSMTILFGKLADIHGRKPVLFMGLAIFATSSLLAGFAADMLTLSILRGLQGLGAGAIDPVAMTVAGELYRGPERGPVQGYFLGMWVLPSLIGPPLGSLVTTSFSWKRLFWLNLPFCCVAVMLFHAFLREDTRENRIGRFDWLGSVLLIVTTVAFVALLVASGRPSSLPSVVAAIVFFVSLVVLLWQQSRQDRSVLSLSLWKHPPIAVANGAPLSTDARAASAALKIVS